MQDSADRSELVRQTTQVGQLLIREEVRVKAYILSVLHDAEAADEVFQQTAVTTLEKAGQFQPGSNFRAWMLAIARLACLAHLRARSARTFASSELIDLLADDGAGIKDEPQRVVSILYECLEQVTPDARSLLIMRYVEGKSVEAIAALFRRTVQATYALIKRLKSKIRECLERKSGFSALPVEEAKP